MSTPKPFRFSLAGRITAAFLGVLVVMAAIATAAATLLPRYLPVPWWAIFLLTLGVGLPLGAWAIGRVLRPLGWTLSGLSDGIRSFHDHDFSMRLASRREDELGELARLYNEVADTLLEERKAIRQRELLLQTALNRSPAAIVLVNQRDRVVYSNREARQMLLGGAKLEGRLFADIRAGCPEQMREILASEADGIFTVQHEDQPETYHLSQRRFQLNRRRHTLVQLRRMTGELGRQEAEIWKKVIRVISHELNNSLAPISSLVHSAKVLSAEPEQAVRSAEVFDTIRERIDHLKRFIEGYARFARLPQPRREEIEWADFLASLGEDPALRIAGRIPSSPARFDPAQMRQVLINLIKNAHEASDGDAEIRLRVDATPEGGTYVQVADRGRGMDEETMKKALLPFYSTKSSGSGLGLPLCREILEAHGGKISLQGRAGGGLLVTCWLPPQ